MNVLNAKSYSRSQKPNEDIDNSKNKESKLQKEVPDNLQQVCTFKLTQLLEDLPSSCNQRIMYF